VSLIKRESLDEDLVAFRRQLDHLFDAFLGREPFDLRKEHWFPTIDEVESDKEIVIRAELPGVDEKDLSVTLLGNTLRIKGEKKSEKEEKGKNFHRTENYYGTFERALPLSASVDAEKIKADYTKGVLEIRLPKKPELKAKEIPVLHS